MISKSQNRHPIHRRRVCKSAEVRVDVQPGPASPAQKAAWRKFWRKLISEVKSDERKNPQ